MTTMRLVLLGPPGVGKGTQAPVLSQAFGVRVLATGELFRSHIQSRSETGVQIEQIVASGGLVPDSIVDSIVEHALDDLGERGFVLDGYPRTPEQVRFLHRVLADRGLRLDAAIHFSAPRTVVLERLGRRGETGARADDDPEVVARRVDLYEAQEQRILGAFEGLAPVLGIDATRGPVAVTEDILSALERSSARRARHRDR
jgi:adenylate kinase